LESVQESSPSQPQIVKKGPLTPFEFREIIGKRHPEQLKLNGRLATIRRVPLQMQPEVRSFPQQHQVEEVVLHPDDGLTRVSPLARMHPKIGANLQCLQSRLLAGLP
jgi:hypothetical protein